MSELVTAPTRSRPGALRTWMLEEIGEPDQMLWLHFGGTSSIRPLRRQLAARLDPRNERRDRLTASEELAKHLWPWHRRSFPSAERDALRLFVRLA